ncbi:hypothetical protein SAMN03159444_01635 [Pseudomonas sp. NFACC02]|uniref:oxygenase MpaB family protein n=1 Tax=Pseudomonas sp. NFACC02 TaxID=1566250 RepID=UPI0008CF69E2|nr:oxygenase MpaB family protein [Pseudomonas sp. NFACC02]SEQ40895.1 hypothetical protein SAMN03159444_01635 [Pseudomonas sp. NFACC02]
MSSDNTAEASTRQPNRVVSRERLLGQESRWRRHGEPTPAGTGEVIDHGVFGPGSVAWEVLLHPATIVFQSAAQFVLQLTYKPIFAGVRDWDPISKKAGKGTLTLFDMFDRAQRNSGIHAPMWLGDKATAQRVAKHLMNIHAKVAGDVVDPGNPELGGYAANSPRESMWAVLTEMHSMLWLYESLAFRGARLPRKLSAATRDQFIAEVAEYARLFPAAEENLPSNMAELRKLYERDAALFGGSDTIMTIPETGKNWHHIVQASIENNYHPSQFKVKVQMFFQNKLFRMPVLASVSGKTRESMGISKKASRKIFLYRALMLPVIWFLQQPCCERYFMRMMWGPDAVKLIKSARELHAQAMKGRVIR